MERCPECGAKVPTVEGRVVTHMSEKRGLERVGNYRDLKPEKVCHGSGRRAEEPGRSLPIC